ncbi:MAG: hypothetical protein MUE91_03675 [Ignavibacteriaceae bacterium]|jgi:hypothetical protein|nr:hypothetical protein [Ignavibacteriaceae bacterium]
MKKILLFLLASGMLYINFPQSLNGRFSSSIYTFERFDTAGSSTTNARTYQMLSFNFGNENIWLRSNFNLETDLSNKQLSDPRFRVYNLYADFQKIFDVASLKLGRQPLYNSVAGGVFDGATVGLNYSGYKLMAYYGGNVPAYQKLELIDNWNDNYLLGGEFTVYAIMDWRFSAKYINKNFASQSYTAVRLDPDLNPINVLIENQSNQYQFLSGEISYNKQKFGSGNIRYDYDLNFQTSSRFEISGRYEQIKNLGITAYYNYREPKIRYNSIFSVFDYGNTWEIEGGLDYLIDNKYTLIGKFANVTYKDERSQRVTLGISSPFGSITARKNFGYAGEMDAISFYTALTQFDGLLTPSLGFSYTRYKLSEDDPSNDLISVLGGANIRPFRTLSFDIQGQYLNNKIYNNDWRLFFKLNFWFNTIF